VFPRGSVVSGPEPRDSRRRVLVVDDDADWRHFLAECLADLGYRAMEASSGEEALALLAHQAFGIILLDLRMPGMNGEEVARRLPGGAGRVVFLTGAPVDEVGPALRQGPHYYLPKGANRQELSMLLEALDAVA